MRRVSRPIRHNRKASKCRTRKLSYPTEFKALEALKIIRRRGNDNIPIRTYECEFCGQWHLTSRPDRYVLIDYTPRDPALRGTMMSETPNVLTEAPEDPENPGVELELEEDGDIEEDEEESCEGCGLNPDDCDCDDEEGEICEGCDNNIDDCECPVELKNDVIDDGDDDDDDDDDDEETWDDDYYSEDDENDED